MSKIINQGLVHKLGCQAEVGRAEMTSLLIDKDSQVYNEVYRNCWAHPCLITDMMHHSSKELNLESGKT